jgi:ankyrin repeat protein
LWCVVSRKNADIIKLLLDTGKVDLNTKDRDGLKLLVLAVLVRDEATVKLLLDTDEADLDATDSN